MGDRTGGFAAMDRERQREIAQKGGQVAHLRGTAHEWTTEEAAAAGRKGGLASARKRAERKRAAQQAEASVDPNWQPRIL